MTTIPKYRCIKEVHALEISSVDYEVTGKVVIIFKDPFPPREVPPEVVARYRPVKGDFFVIYSDEYVAISPRAPFLDGYVPISESRVKFLEPTTMDGGYQLEAKKGPASPTDEPGLK